MVQLNVAAAFTLKVFFALKQEGLKMLNILHQIYLCSNGLLTFLLDLIGSN